MYHIVIYYKLNYYQKFRFREVFVQFWESSDTHLGIISQHTNQNHLTYEITFPYFNEMSALIMVYNSPNNLAHLSKGKRKDIKNIKFFPPATQFGPDFCFLL